MGCPLAAEFSPAGPDPKPPIDPGGLNEKGAVRAEGCSERDKSWTQRPRRESSGHFLPLLGSSQKLIHFSYPSPETAPCGAHARGALAMTIPRSGQIVLAAVAAIAFVVLVIEPLLPKGAPRPAPTAPPHGKADSNGFAVVDEKAVIDTHTGLYWSAEADRTDLYWTDACDSGRLGWSWRIPTELEMARVVARHPSTRQLGVKAVFWIADKRLMDSSLRAAQWPDFTVEYPSSYSLCVASSYRPSRR